MTSGPAEAPVPSGYSKDIYALGRKLDDLQRRLDQLETQRSIVATSVQADINTSNGFFFGSYGEALFRLVDVPRGYSQCYVLLFCSAGQTLAGTGSGNVGVFPVASGVSIGPAIANGVTGGGPVSVASVGAQLLTGLPPGSQIRLATWCANIGTLTPGSANVHLSASLLFLR